ncbi:hypothetical protein GOBAR_DD33405 [Gossypium barbadense]|nr:hypothetical protein GOBAR_DD33405 [Gossypium barbadense]
MKRVLFRGISLTTRNILHSYTKTNQNPVQSFNPLAASTRSRLKFYSSESDSPIEKKPDLVIESASVAEAHVVPCAVLALCIHPTTSHNLLNRISWAFCVYLEAVSVLPQLRVMQNTKIVEPFTAHYVFALGVARTQHMKALLKVVYELYTNYVLKNPFYEMEMPI